ncbi:MAG: PAS domain S-box protein [Candidatus Micrarchaeota archaeon]
MNARLKTALILCATAAASILLAYYVLQTTMLGSYARLEAERSQVNAERAESRLQADIGGIRSNAQDYAHWDDTYEFAIMPNDKFPVSGMPTSILQNLNLNFGIVLNASVTSTLIRAYDYSLQSGTTPPVGLMERLNTADLLKNNLDGLTSKCGLVTINGDILALCVESILASDSSGPARGWLVFGRWMDRSYLQLLSDELQMPIEFYDLKSNSTPSGVKSAGYEIIGKNEDNNVRTINDTLTEAYEVFNDFDGKAAYVLRISQPREIYQVGRESFWQLLFSIASITIIFGILSLLLMNRLVIGRIYKLKSQVAGINSGSNRGKKIPVDGDDEVQELASSINKMLADIDAANQNLVNSEEKYRILTENLTDVVVKFSLDGIVEYCSPAMKNFAGYGVMEVEGQPISKFFADRKQLEKALEEIGKAVQGTEEDKNFEFLFKAKDRQPFYAEIRTKTIFANGKPLSLQGVLHDVSERRKFEDELSLKDNAIETAASPIGFLSLDGSLIYANDAFVRQWGYVKKEEMLGRPYTDFTPEAQGIFEQISSKGSYRGEITCKKKGGEFFEAELVASRVVGRDGNVICLMGSYTDITARKKYESELAIKGLLLDSVTDSIFLMDLTGRFKYFNETMPMVHGYNREEFGKMHLQDVLSEKDVKLLPERMSKLLKEGVAQTICTHKRKDGSTFECESHSRTIDLGGERMILSIGRDITARIRLEGTLKASEAKYKEIYESSNDAIMLLAPPSWKFISCNPAALKLFKVKSEEEFKRLGPWDISPEFQPDGASSGEKAQKMIMGAMAQGSNFFEWVHRCLYGDNFPATVLLSKISIEGRDMLQATVRDMTLKQKAEKALEDSVAEIKRLDQTKSEFLNMVSHELKTPITAISAHLDVLDDFKENLTAQELKSLEAIRRNKEQLRILIENILEISRMESGRFELNYVDADIAQIIDEIIAELRIVAREKGIGLSSAVESIPPIEADDIRLKEIIVNLTTNAIKFTEKGAVKIRAEQKGEFAVISVIDEGIGIPKEKIDKLFQKFYQIDASADRKYGGSGLGLSIVKMLAEAHGGKVDVSSVLGKGSVFTVTLPISKPGKEAKAI